MTTKAVYTMPGIGDGEVLTLTFPFPAETIELEMLAILKIAWKAGKMVYLNGYTPPTQSLADIIDLDTGEFLVETLNEAGDNGETAVFDYNTTVYESMKWHGSIPLDTIIAFDKEHGTKQVVDSAELKKAQYALAFYHENGLPIPGQ
jgi:hypothetical protein